MHEEIRFGTSGSDHQCVSLCCSVWRDNSNGRTSAIMDYTNDRVSTKLLLWMLANCIQRVSSSGDASQIKADDARSALPISNLQAEPKITPSTEHISPHHRLDRVSDLKGDLLAEIVDDLQRHAGTVSGRSKRTRYGGLYSGPDLGTSRLSYLLYNISEFSDMILEELTSWIPI